MTREKFLAWREQFELERKAQQAKEEEEKLKGMTPKEREEYKRLKAKPSGRQLFERGDFAEKTSAADKADEDAQEIDWDRYDRETREQERLRAEQEERDRQDFENMRFDDDEDDD